MNTSAVSQPLTARVRWAWLWSPKTDLVWNLLPFWLGFALAGGLYATRDIGTAKEPMWSFTFAGRELNVLLIAFGLYGPLIDGPHLWATIARTYTDAEEWATRRALFLSSLLAFAIGPALILLPYAIHAFIPLPAHTLDWGWRFWGFAFGNYAIYHINKQHWGFVCLYKRKNGDYDDVLENRVDAWFFQTAIWLPYLAMMTAPWDARTAASPFYAAAFAACHYAFWVACIGYVLFQLSQVQRGVTRNGPKLIYVGTIITLYYITFACHPRLAAFWVLITGTGHCLQYHAVVWAYGKKRYAGNKREERRLPNFIFDNIWLYAALGFLFALITLQGPGSMTMKQLAAGFMQSAVFSHVFTFLDPNAGIDIGVKIGAAVIAGVRLHHFYVDSKIWRVGKSAALAKNLNL